MDKHKDSLLSMIGKQVISMVIATGLSIYVSTRILDSRVTALESQAREVQSELKGIAQSVNRMAGSFETFTSMVREELRSGNARANR